MQVPHGLTVRANPQLSVPLTVPQSFPSRAQNAESVSLQPQTLATPPPAQLSGLVQVPQLCTVRITPQLSGPLKVPQFLLSLAQRSAPVSGIQLQTLATQAFCAL